MKEHLCRGSMTRWASGTCCVGLVVSKRMSFSNMFQMAVNLGSLKLRRVPCTKELA